MALLHQAELHPSKLELLSSWVPTQSWFPGAAGGQLSTVAAYRFDDPAGEVGVETILVQAGTGPTLQVPVTYRASPLEGADAALMGTMDHSVLGKRWVYDGAGDPVYLQTVATASLNGGHQAELFVDTAEGRVTREPTAVVEGNGLGESPIAAPSLSDLHISQAGTVTTIDAPHLRVRIQRVIGGDALAVGDRELDDRATSAALMGTWTGSAPSQEIIRVSLK